MVSLVASAHQDSGFNVSQYDNDVRYSGRRSYRSATVIQFQRLEDPRIALRNSQLNKVVVPPDYGNTSNTPVPSTRGGELAQTTLSYEQIKSQLLSQGLLFEDPEFPATNDSLYYSGPPSMHITWLRPH
ncbi:unnamed protein product, partial [Dicrocoelium dendriticum]